MHSHIMLRMYGPVLELLPQFGNMHLNLFLLPSSEAGQDAHGESLQPVRKVRKVEQPNLFLQPSQQPSLLLHGKFLPNTQLTIVLSFGQLPTGNEKRSLCTSSNPASLTQPASFAPGSGSTPMARMPSVVSTR